VVGHFDAVYGAWRDWHAAREGGDFDFSAGFLDAAARVSVGLALRDAEAERRDDDEADDMAPADGREHQPPADAPAPTPVLHASMALVWRILVAWLVVLALFVLAGYV
jgi:AmpE protein